jgi:hypothetical protein
MNSCVQRYDLHQRSGATLLLKAQQQLPNHNLITIAQRLWLARHQALAVKHCAIGAVQIFDIYLPTLYREPHMASANAIIECAIRGQINIRVKIAHRVASANNGLGRCW